MKRYRWKNSRNFKKFTKMGMWYVEWNTAIYLFFLGLTAGVLLAIVWF